MGDRLSAGKRAPALTAPRALLRDQHQDHDNAESQKFGRRRSACQRNHGEDRDRADRSEEHGRNPQAFSETHITDQEDGDAACKCDCQCSWQCVAEMPDRLFESGGEDRDTEKHHI